MIEFEDHPNEAIDSEAKRHVSAIAEALLRRSGLAEKIGDQLKGFSFPEIDFMGLSDRMARVGAQMGAQGWTFPMHATPREAEQIAEQGATTGDLDGAFLEYFDDGGYKALKVSLSAKSQLAQWDPLIDQAFTAFEMNLYALVVPSLFTAFEGHLAASANDKQTRAIKMARALRESASPQSITLAVLLSVEEFVKLVYSPCPFDGARPLHLNRHWILHGRDQASWGRADCLRLFQAIDTIRD